MYAKCFEKTQGVATAESIQTLIAGGSSWWYGNYTVIFPCNYM